MITRVRVKNFRSLADVDVTLGPLTVLVGQNGAGKSAFVDVLRFVRDALRLGVGTAIDQRNGLAALRRWMPETKPDVEITLDVEGLSTVGRYSFQIAHAEPDTYTIMHEESRFGEESFVTQEGKQIVHNFFEEGDRVTQLLDPKMLVLPALRVLGSKTLDILYQLLTTSDIYTIWPDRLREPQKATNGPILKDHAENLAYCIQQVQQSAWADRLRNFYQMGTGITNIKIEPVGGGYLLTKTEHISQDGISSWFDLAQESDGTIRMLALLVALYQDITGAVIGIEEPELSLHPGALSVLSEAIKEASLRNQIIITTQSPDFISEFSVEDLRVVEQIDGITSIGPLEERQRKFVKDQLFTTGELLRFEGLHNRAMEPVSVGNA